MDWRPLFLFSLGSCLLGLAGLLLKDLMKKMLNRHRRGEAMLKDVGGLFYLLLLLSMILLGLLSLGPVFFLRI